MGERVYNPQCCESIDLSCISGIYQIRNLINGKIYVGSTKDLRRRQQTHFRSLARNKHDNPYLQAAYNKYGKENFVFEIIEFCSVKERFDFEQYWIDRFIGKECYNINPFASSPPINNTKGVAVKDSVKRQISNTLKNKHKNDVSYREHMRKVYDDRIGKHLSGRHRECDFIICLETKEEFESPLQAEILGKGNSASIYRCCLGKICICNGYHWMFKTDYLNLSPEQLQEKLLSTAANNQVVCLETEVIYITAKSAQQNVGVSSQQILECCKNKIVQAGGFHWVYYKDFKDMSEQDKKNKLNSKISTWRQCKCLETNKIYKNVSEAAKDMGLRYNAVYDHCKGKKKHVKGYHFEFVQFQ